MKYCSKCGSPINEDMAFCINCGEKISTSELPNEDLDTLVKGTDGKSAHKHKKIILLFLVGLIVTACTIAFAITSKKNIDPLVGHWIAVSMTVANNKTVSIPKGHSYMDINEDGTFLLHLDEKTTWNGKWALHEMSDKINASLGILYQLETENIKPIVYLDDSTYDVLVLNFGQGLVDYTMGFEKQS